MFTGIVKEVGIVEEVLSQGEGREITVRCKLAASLSVDQSVCLNGVCHTVTAGEGELFSVQSVPETLRKTNIGSLEAGHPVNLEPAMRPGQLLDGHMVQGHVDATGTLKDISRRGNDRLLSISYPGENRGLLVGRGSICVDGISLTVARLEEERFTVAVIPYTWEHTNLHTRSEGDQLNLEFDILGKYVARQLELRGG
ncbi:MAG: riboflavin synthase [Balneolaceae bacterium]|nr:riboflavin synthase [Balneolaceae bacterium]